MNRQQFIRDHPGLFLLDVAHVSGLQAYLAGRGLLAEGEGLTAVVKAGEGNMNCTVRATTSRQRFIVKQARPWVEKYDHIDAPWDRSLVEAAFYRAVSAEPALAGHMPRLIDDDPTAHVLILEDKGQQGDLTSIYAGAPLPAADGATLRGYLCRLHQCGTPPAERTLFENREMRALNHEHIFRLPLRPDNGLALDEVTPGLQGLAGMLQRDRAYVQAVEALGERYLADGASLVHGDYFPGSWLRTEDGGVAVIDPEFCFVGAGEFDLGVMMAHLLMARQSATSVESVLAGADAYDRGLARQFAGVEIMRRLIGVAQLPISASLIRKHALLELSRWLVMNP